MPANATSGRYYDLLVNEPTNFVQSIPIDVIVVPAARLAHNLLGAATLAEKTQTPLIVLASKQATGSAVAETLAGKSRLQWAVIEIPDGYRHPLLQMSAADYIPEVARSGTPSDLSLKRNLGLLIGRQFGNRLFFMDDDIHLTPLQLEYAGGLLATYAMAGFRSTDFPDRSVIDHIEQGQTSKTPGIGPVYREDIFISGNALGVDLRRVNDHFQDIYNEDWLFMFASLSRGEVANAGEARQLPYDPFSASRAAREEFGETIAYGLYEACANNQTPQILEKNYWEAVICQRRNRVSALRDDRWPEANLILHEALAVSSYITPEICVKYLKAWQRDQAAWEGRLATLPDFPSLQRRLQAVGLRMYAGTI